jgi:hypothetical protein
MPEEPYPLLAGENLQPIDMLCRSCHVIAIDRILHIIYCIPIYVNSKVLHYLYFLSTILNIMCDIFESILYIFLYSILHLLNIWLCSGILSY